MYQQFRLALIFVILFLISLLTSCGEMQTVSPLSPDESTFAQLAKKGSDKEDDDDKKKDDDKEDDDDKKKDDDKEDDDNSGKGSIKKNIKGKLKCIKAMLSDLLLVRRQEEDADSVSQALIGPEGGVLIHGDHRLEIPAGALTDTTLITFKTLKSDTLIFEFGPHGIEFLQPVKLYLNLDHTWMRCFEDAAVDVAYFNSENQIWEIIPTEVDPKTNEAKCDVTQGNTDHFSRYALSRR